MQHALAGDTLIAKHKQYLITNMSRSLTTVWSLFKRDCIEINIPFITLHTNCTNHAFNSYVYGSAGSYIYGTDL